MQEGVHNLTIVADSALDTAEAVFVTFEMVGQVRGMVVEDFNEITRLANLQKS